MVFWLWSDILKSLYLFLNKREVWHKSGGADQRGVVLNYLLFEVKSLIKETEVHVIKLNFPLIRIFASVFFSYEDNNGSHHCLSIQILSAAVSLFFPSQNYKLSKYFWISSYPQYAYVRLEHLEKSTIQ